MAVSVSTQVSLQSGIYWNQGCVKELRNLNKRGRVCLLGSNWSSVSLRNLNKRGRVCLLGSNLSSVSPHNLKIRDPLYSLGGGNLSSPLRNLKTRDLVCSSVSSEQYSWNTNISKRFLKRAYSFPCKSHVFKCKCSLNLGLGLETAFLKNATLNLAWSCKNWQGSPAMVRLASTVGILIFTIWGLGPVVNLSMNIFWNKSNSSGKKSATHHVTTSYDQDLFYWVGAIIVCRALQPMVLPTKASPFVKNLLNFVGAFSALVTFMYCASSVEQQVREIMETNDAVDTRNMGFRYVDIALAIVVGVTFMILYVELLGFSTEKLMTARIVVIVLFLCAGCEIFTNSLPSSMLHATRPFVVNKWIQSSIEGYEVSRTTDVRIWSQLCLVNNMETANISDMMVLNMGSRFDGRVVFIVVLAAVVTLVIQLLGSSAEEWLAAGVHFLLAFKFVVHELFKISRPSSMIHATRQFVVNEGIQTNIKEGYDVSGTAESTSAEEDNPQVD